MAVPQSLSIGDEAQRIGAPSSRHAKLREVMPEESKNAPFYQKPGFHLMDDGRAMQIVNRG
nr:hypothetical protein [Bifidobacterium longum]